jgi:hypothetical protein
MHRFFTDSCIHRFVVRGYYNPIDTLGTMLRLNGAQIALVLMAFAMGIDIVISMVRLLSDGS